MTETTHSDPYLHGPTGPVIDPAAVRLMRTATYASVSVALVLIITKAGAWTVTGSVSLLSTLMDSVLDALASLINLFAVHHALQPADKEHRFGHGKAEPLAGLAQAAFIFGSGVFIVAEAGFSLLHPQEIAHTDIGYWVMVFSIVLTVGLVAFQRYVVKKSGSVAISADSLHYKTDVLINMSVIVSLFVASNLGIGWADPLFALAIAGYIMFGAWQIGQQSLDILMDKELPDEDRARIFDIVTAHPDVHGMHDLRTRTSGPQVFIQLHLELDGDMRLHIAHQISEAVEADLMAVYPNAEIIIHEDPEGVAELRAEFH